MNHRFFFRWAWGAAGVVLTVAAWVCWDNVWRFSLQDVQNSLAASPMVAIDHAMQVKEGAYLARVGGCVACHTAPQGELMGGARAIETPFGRVYSSNLTLSKSVGIGAWTPQDFWQALHWGRSPDGHLLIPAFPYNHTRVMTRVDSDAVFAWLGTIPVSEQKQPANTLPWPLSTQPALAVWRSLFFKTQDWQNDATQSAQWNRGAYLVEGMGHCAACHGARNALGSFSAVNDLSGAIMQTQHAWAPSLHDPLQTSIAQSTPSELVQLLTTGVNAHGHVMGPMADYVREVSQYWRAEDALAVVTYLKSGQMSAGETQQKPRVAAEVAGRDFLVRGAEIYTQHCESCHGKEGQGQAGRYPPLASNPALDAVPPSNLIQMVLFGGFAPSTQGNPRPWGMPAFLFQLQNEDVAAVLTWTRTQWGHHAPSVKAIDVDQIRSALE